MLSRSSWIKSSSCCAEKTLWRQETASEGFHKSDHIDEVKGIYVPFWLFDADANAQIRYRGAKVRNWSDSQYNFTETTYYSVIRGGGIGFERVPVDGSSKIDDILMESIEPYHFADAVDFQTAYGGGGGKF